MHRSRTPAGFSAAAQATATLDFHAGVAFTTTTNAVVFDIKAANAGTAEDGVAISFANAVGPTSVVYTAGTSLVITADLTAGVTGQSIVDAINAQAPEFTASGSNLTDDVVAADAIAGDGGTTGMDLIDIQAVNAGSDYNNVTVNVVAGAANGAAYNAAQKVLTLTVNQTTPQTVADLATQINTDLGSLFTATATSLGIGTVDATGADATVTDNTGNTGGNVLGGDLVLSIGGSTGREVFNFQAGASVNQIAAAINLVSDATGVMASYATTGLTLNSTTYGSERGR